VLLFDEADAVFGKRSQVRDAHDRHANIESAYLLQRMESFDGIAVLTTNLRTNLDDAFTRRLDVVADFPMPTRPPAGAVGPLPRPADARGDDLDLEFCANRFELAGGSIRSCAITAAYLCAEGGQVLGMADVMSAIVREYRKLGRLLLESEFGPWLHTTGADDESAPAAEPAHQAPRRTPDRAEHAAGPARVLALQRTVGNAAVASALAHRSGGHDTTRSLARNRSSGSRTTRKVASATSCRRTACSRSWTVRGRSGHTRTPRFRRTGAQPGRRPDHQRSGLSGVPDQSLDPEGLPAHR